MLSEKLQTSDSITLRSVTVNVSNVNTEFEGSSATFRADIGYKKPIKAYLHHQGKLKCLKRVLSK